MRNIEMKMACAWRLQWISKKRRLGFLPTEKESTSVNFIFGHHSVRRPWDFHEVHDNVRERDGKEIQI